MNSQFVRHAPSAKVCAFCAVRLQVARSIPIRLSHPRSSFHSSSRFSQENGGEQGPWRIGRRDGLSGPSYDAPALRSHPQQMRQGRQAPVQKSNNVLEKRSQLQEKLNTSNGTHRPDWICPKCGRFNPRNNTACKSCRNQRETASRWSCQTCRTENSGRSLDCRGCHPQLAGQSSKLPEGPSISKVSADLSFFEESEESGRSSQTATRDDSINDTGRNPWVFEEPSEQSSSKVEKPIPRSGLSGDLSFLEEADQSMELNQPVSKNEVNTPRPQNTTRGPDRHSAQSYTRRDYVDDPRAHEVKSRPKFQQRAARQRSWENESDNFGEDEDNASKRKARKEQRKKTLEARKQAAATPSSIVIPEFISVTNLASLLKVRVEDFLKKMQNLGFDELSYDHVLDNETASLIAAEFNFEAVASNPAEHDILPTPPAADKSILPPRPPVVTIMGHVDHGKTTLLDYLRKSSIAASEHGGITQHIGAFIVPMSSSGRPITFLDTPGHEAFLSMRKRGADVTDIVILVVAADDSVKPQTIEAIKHAQSANVPIIVAINKIDKPDADVERVKQDLGRYGVEIEDFGGDTQTVLVSGKTGQGIPELEDATVALADILDLRAETNAEATEGWVLESTSSKSAGRVATVLIRRGTLKVGDVIVAGTSWARVRGLRNEAGAPITHAPPGTPAEIDGWRSEPVAGDKVLPAPSEQKAKDVVAHRMEQRERNADAQDIAAVNEARRLEQEKRDAEQAAKEAAKEAGKTFDPAVLESGDVAKKSDEGGQKQLSLIVKTDVSGSLDAVTTSILVLSSPLITPRILRSSVGSVTEFDIDVASTSSSTLILFNTDISPPMRRLAEEKGVKVMEERIIYRLIDGVRFMMEERLEPIRSKRVLGEAEVGMVFGIKVKGVKGEVMVAGCRVRNGVIERKRRVRVLRGGAGEGEEVFDGSLNSLKNMKKDVTEMRKGTECGIGFEGWGGFEVGDQIQSYEEVLEKRRLT